MKFWGKIYGNKNHDSNCLLEQGSKLNEKGRENLANCWNFFFLDCGVVAWISTPANPHLPLH
jgi:hypothetical protein